MKLKKKATAPITTDYRPELDASPELNPSDAAYYQSLIGILQWAVELGRIDITCEVSMLSSLLALPCEGHLQQVYHIFAYLKCHHNSRIVFDPTCASIDYENFPRKDWTSQYRSGRLKIDLSCNEKADQSLSYSKRTSHTNFCRKTLPLISVGSP
jgi:hypothetical protein